MKKTILMLVIAVSLFCMAGCKNEEPSEVTSYVVEEQKIQEPVYIVGRDNLQSGHYYIEKKGGFYKDAESGTVEYEYFYSPDSETESIGMAEDGSLFIQQRTENQAFGDSGILNVEAPEDRTYYESYIGSSSVQNPAENGVSNDKVLFFNDDFNKIPTMYTGDRIIYCYDSGVVETFTLERYEDMGYSVGLCGLVPLASGRYYLDTEYEEDASLFRICEWSDADTLYYAETEGFVIDTIGGEKLRAESGYVSRCGTINGLTKDGKYLFNMYIGTRLNQYVLTANVRMLGSWTAIELTEYEFLECNIATFEIPDYIEDGYYTINGSGVFKICRKIPEWATPEEMELHDMNVPITFPSDIEVQASENSEYLFEGNEYEVGNITFEAGVSADEELLHAVYDGYGEHFNCKYLGAVKQKTQYTVEYEKLYSGYAIELIPDISVWFIKDGRLNAHIITEGTNSYTFTRKPEDGDCIIVLKYFDNTIYNITEAIAEDETAVQKEQDNEMTAEE